ncbi:MAG: hypothetical protein IPG58_12745 [Acidobacteria bacterium]|nr:hypothetical protein [Acidobacteriota bacterium]
MVVRAIALSLALLVGGTVLIPLATDQAEAGPKNKRKKRQAKKYKKYSKAWWRQYRARMKQKRNIAARKRALRLRQLRLARARAANKNTAVAKTSTPKTPKAAPATTGVLPTGDQAPAGWTAASSTPAELKFRVDNSAGDQVGSASISVVGPAVGESTGGRNKTVGGVATTALRREVIDRMIRENGWVVKDYKTEISGQQVYVVVAQSQAKNGGVQSRMFYFTEVDGKIYNVATNSPAQESERLAEESEKVINSLKNRVRPALRASVENK